MLTEQERAAIELAVGTQLYEAARANDSYLPNVEVQGGLFRHLVETGQAEGLTFAEYLGGCALGPKAARRYDAALEKAIQQAEAAKREAREAKLQAAHERADAAAEAYASATFALEALENEEGN